jgi:hypothetical protein
VTALVTAVGENKLMPTPDCDCVVINGKSGYSRSNSSWVLGRLVRDYEKWMDPYVKHKVDEIILESWTWLKTEAIKNRKPAPERPKQAGLCVSVYKPDARVRAGESAYDWLYISAFVVAIFQLGIAAIPCGLWGDWGILMITASGIFLSFVMGGLSQWKNEKWACRRLDEDHDKNVVLTRGNGSQHAIIILGGKGFLNLEDLAGGQTNVDVATSNTTRIIIAGLTVLWILLLITAAAIKKNTWFLLAVGGIGILENIFIAGWRRKPAALGIPLEFVDVVGNVKVMEALYEVEAKHPYVGRSILETFFPGKLRPHEEIKWNEYEKTAKARAKAIADAVNGTAQNANQIVP